MCLCLKRVSSQMYRFFLEKKHLHLVSVTVTMLINMNAFHNCSLFQLNLKHFPRDYMEVSFQDVDRLNWSSFNRIPSSRNLKYSCLETRLGILGFCSFFSSKAPGTSCTSAVKSSPFCSFSLQRHLVLPVPPQ